MGDAKDIPQFDGGSPDDWEDYATRMDACLTLKELGGLLEGAGAVPAARAPQYTKVTAILRLSLSKEVARSVRNLPAREAWVYLKGMYGNHNARGVPRLQAEIQNRTWRRDDTVRKYHSDIRALNQTLVVHDRGYEDAELKSICYRNLPEKIRSLGGRGALDEDITFDDWLNDIATLQEMGHDKEKEKDEARALYSKHAPRKAYGKEATRPRRDDVIDDGDDKQRKTHKCFRCLEIVERSHIANTCRASWESILAKHPDKAFMVLISPLPHTDCTSPSQFVAVADNGCTRHVVTDIDLLRSVRHFDNGQQPRIEVAGGDVLLAKATGHATVFVYDQDGVPRSIELNDCLYVPQGANLLSISQLIGEGAVHEYVQGPDEARLDLANGNSIPLRMDRGLVWLESVPDTVNDDADEVALAAVSLTLMHERLNHASKDRLLQVLEQHPEIKDKVDDDLLSPCRTCHLTKAIRQPMSRENTDHSDRKAGSLLVIDLAGPIKTPTAGGKRFALIIKDAATNFTEVELLKDKTAESVLRAFQSFVTKQRATRPHGSVPITSGETQLQMDNDSSFLSSEMLAYLSEINIHVRTSGPDTPTRQGKAESGWHRLFQDTRALLKGSAAPKSAWGLALVYAAHIHNHLPSTTLEGLSPLQALTGSVPTIGHLKKFGCRVYVWRDKRHRAGKLDDPAEEGVYVGESPHGHGHLVIVNGRLRTSNHATFDETISGFAPQDQEDDHMEEQEQERVEDEAEHVEDEQAKDAELHNMDEPQAIATPPVRENIFTQLSEQVKAPSISAFVALADPDEDLNPTWQEALTSEQADDWKREADKEIRGIHKRGTFTILTDESQVPAGEQILDMVLACKVKTCPTTGSITRRKVRACIRGFAQRNLPPTVRTSADVTIPSSVKLLLSICSALDLTLGSADFVQAFLNGKLHVPVYVRPPDGVCDLLPPGCVLYVTGALYGLAESAARWQESLTDALLDMNFKQSFHDQCFFYKVEDGVIFLLVVHVDDALFASSPVAIGKFTTELARRFDITVADNIDNYLGFHLQRRVDGAFLITQPVKIARALEVMGMGDCNAVATPVVPNSQVSEDDDAERLDDHHHQLFRQCLGELRHICVTYRFDISVALNHLSRFAAKPTNAHFRGLQHLLKYIKGTATLPLVLGASKDIVLTAYSDATWNGDYGDGTNTTGALFYICGGTIDAVSHKQDCVTSSTCHSEMVALATTAKAVVHYRSLLEELGFNQPPTPVFTDNAACVDISKTRGTTKKTRHVDKAHFLFQEYKSKGFLNIMFVSGADQYADAMTKALHKDKFIKCRSFIMGE